jgi:uncharacterized protein (DUF1800 family)
MKLSTVQVNHLYNRACFGISYDKFLAIEEVEEKAVLNRLFEDSFQAKELQVFGAPPNQEIIAQIRAGKITRQEARKMIQDEVRASRDKIRSLNVAWVEQMHSQASAGLEKLVYFWHDHFGVRILNGYQAQTHNNTLRRYALSNYKELLTAVAQDPAMLNFLNNQQNIKAEPNENFARELLELFTLGRGNYTEQDIKEAARAFTGWRIDRRTNRFMFDSRNHDSGMKTFMGERGRFDGNDIIKIILNDKQTAKFLAAKFYAYYVSDKPNEQHIQGMADHYYQTNYNTQSLLAYTFAQAWFYEKEQMQSKIKSPLELINGLHNQLGLQFGNKAGWVLLQVNFTQVMFYPPSVAGWPTGKEWIDSSSLVNRMKLPSVLAGLDQIRTEESPEVDATDPFQNINRRQVLESAELGLWAYQLPDKSANEQVISVEEYLFNGRLPLQLHETIVREYHKQSNAKKKNWLFMTLASMPEYQMV